MKFIKLNRFSSGMGGGFGGGGFRSVSQQTSIINGKQVTTKTTSENGVETVERIENGQLGTAFIVLCFSSYYNED